MTLDEVNEAVRDIFGTYENPSRTISGYRLFLREFIPSDRNNLLVAICLAWPDKILHQPRFYYAVVGSHKCGEYFKGQLFDVSDVRITDSRLNDENPSFFIKEIAEAMERLQRIVTDMPVRV